MNDFAIKVKMQASSIDLLSELSSLQSLIPNDFKMDNEPEETNSTITYQKSFARHKWSDFYKIKQNRGLQLYNDSMALIFQHAEDYDEWNLSFVKITPEGKPEGKIETKEDYDWSGSHYLGRYNMKKDHMDLDGEMVICTNQG